jgi:hypothetical protein
MPDPPNSVEQPQAPRPAAPATQPDAGHVPMSEEFDRAKWTLPPVIPLVIAVVAVAILVAVLVFSTRVPPAIAGTITKVVSADQQGSTMVAVQVKLDNKSEKQLWLQNVRSELETADGKKYRDHAAAAVDVDRYLRAFPALMEAKADPLRDELKIAPGASYTGVTVFAFPVDQAAFAARKSFTVRIEMYDQPAIELKQ